MSVSATTGVTNFTERTLRQRTIDSYGSLDQQVLDFISGERDSVVITSEGDLDHVYKARHALLNVFVCEKLGEVAESCHIPPPLTIDHMTEYARVKQMTPDSLHCEDGKAVLVEVSVTQWAEPALRHKKQKYLPLEQYLELEGYEVLSWYVVVEEHSYASLTQLLGLPDTQQSEIDVLWRELSRFRKLISRLMADPVVREYKMLLFNKTRRPESLPTIPSDRIQSMLDELPNNPLGTMSYKEFVKEVESVDGYTSDITLSDDIFMNNIVRNISLQSCLDANRSPLSTPTRNLDSLISEFYRDSNARILNKQDKVPEILRFPVFHAQPRTTNQRETLDKLADTLPVDCEVLSTLKFALQELRLDSEAWAEFTEGEIKYSKDQRDFSRASERCRRNIIKIRPTSEELREMHRAGPDRKAAIRKGMHHEDPHKGLHLGYKAISEELVLELQEQIDNLRLPLHHRPLVQLKEDRDAVLSPKIDSISGQLAANPWIALLQQHSVLAAEVLLNAGRRRGGKEFIVCTTPYEGVYILIGPGARMRTEQNPIWFRVFGNSAVFNVTMGSNTERLTRGWWISKWRSLDSARLETLVRCEDQIILSYLAMLDQSVSSNSSLEAKLRQDLAKSDTLAIMSMCVIENKSCTSSSNQMARYFLMKALGDRNFTGIFSKLSDPVRSHLQAALVLRYLRAVSNICKTPLSDLVGVGKTVVVDDIPDEFSGAASSKIPRLLTRGPNENFHFILNEIYFCMLYNKDRQNKTHDSMKILKKILKEELLLESEEAKAQYNYQMGLADYDEIKKEMTAGATRRSHFYSHRAVLIGSKLQAAHSANLMQHGLAYHPAHILPKIKRSFEEFASTRSSVRSICKDVSSETELIHMADRSKCIETVLEVVERHSDCDNSLDLAKKLILEYEVMIQIFKKNQIGGTREIIILDMLSRIIINLAESVARVICDFDTREQLTNGKDKKLQMKREQVGMMREIEANEVSWMFENSDMETWCQKFLPMMFYYIFAPHRAQLGSLLPYIFVILAKHVNKTMEVPKALVQQWILHPEMKHEDAGTQRLKEQYQATRNPTFVNRSNMCQGILHYISSVHHLALISFRDEIFSRYCAHIKIHRTLVTRTMVSSDDRLTIMLAPQGPEGLAQFVLHDVVSNAVERLFAVKRSLPKTSLSPHIMEFNSCFSSYQSAFSPAIKFSAASMHIMDSRSFSSMVQESYSTILQLRENGSSSLVIRLAHLLNKQFTMNLYKTLPGQQNDLEELLGIPRSQIPYDYGVYPIVHFSYSEISGPEIWNYALYKQRNNAVSLRLLSAIYKHDVAKPDDVGEIWNENMDSIDVFKRGRLQIKMGVVRLHKDMLARTKTSGEEVRVWFSEHPELLLRRSQTNEEAAYKIRAQLLAPGVADSLRHVAPALFYLRSGAAASAPIWKMFGQLEFVKLSTATINCVRDSVELTLNQEEKVNFFPQYVMYDWLLSYDTSSIRVKQARPRNMPMAVRNVTLSNPTTVLSSSLPQLLQKIYINDMGGMSVRDMMDWRVLKTHFPYLRDSLSDMTELSSRVGYGLDRIFVTMMRVSKTFEERRMQLYMYGKNSRALTESLDTIVKFNTEPGFIYSTNIPYETTGLVMGMNKEHLDNLINIYNYLCVVMAPNGPFHRSDPRDALEALRIKEGSSWLSGLDYVALNMSTMTNLSGLRFQDQSICIILLQIIGEEARVRDLLNSSSILHYHWVKKQSKRGHLWLGDFVLDVRYKTEKARITGREGEYTVHLKTMLVPRDFKRMLELTSKLLEPNRGVKISPCFYGHGIIRISTQGSWLEWCQPADDNIRSVKTDHDFFVKDMTSSKTLRLNFGEKRVELVERRQALADWVMLSQPLYIRPIIREYDYKIKDLMIGGIDLQWLLNDGIINSVDYQFTPKKIKEVAKVMDCSRAYFTGEESLNDAIRELVFMDNIDYEVSDTEDEFSEEEDDQPPLSMETFALAARQDIVSTFRRIGVSFSAPEQESLPDELEQYVPESLLTGVLGSSTIKRVAAVRKEHELSRNMINRRLSKLRSLVLYNLVGTLPTDVEEALDVAIGKTIRIKGIKDRLQGDNLIKMQGLFLDLELWISHALSELTQLEPENVVEIINTAIAEDQEALAENPNHLCIAAHELPKLQDFVTSKFPTEINPVRRSTQDRLRAAMARRGRAL